MLIVTGIVTVSQADLDSFHEDLKRLADHARGRSGNLAYDVAVVDIAQGDFLVTERWADQAALNGHLESIQTTSFIQLWASRIGSDIRKYDAYNERNLDAS